MNVIDFTIGLLVRLRSKGDHYDLSRLRENHERKLL